MPSSDPAEVVHIAGGVVTANGVKRQRCMWCGALLLEYDLANVARPLEPGEDPDAPWSPAMFDVGSHVAVSGTWPKMMRVVEPDPHPEQEGDLLIPDGSCLDLDPAVTR